MIASMRHIPVAVATVITLCTPLVVIPASYWLMKNQERIGAATLIGACDHDGRRRGNRSDVVDAR